jgi:hypothetical protein
MRCLAGSKLRVHNRATGSLVGTANLLGKPISAFGWAKDQRSMVVGCGDFSVSYSPFSLAGSVRVSGSALLQKIRLSSGQPGVWLCCLFLPQRISVNSLTPAKEANAFFFVAAVRYAAPLPSSPTLLFRIRWPLTPPLVGRKVLS